MAISRKRKQEQLAELEALFKEAEGIAFATFKGATVGQVQDIRRELRTQDMRYIVAKKTLMALAAKNAGKVEFDSDLLEGAVAVLISQNDSVAPAAAVKKMIKDTFDKETETSVFSFAGAIFEGRFLDQAETAQLANTPSREESLAKIVGMLKSGPQKLHSVLQSGIRGMVNVMDQAEKFTS